MVLRKLQMQDAEAMFGWMHDADVVRYLDKSFAEKTVEDCRDFIRESSRDRKNLHLAITNKDDAYVGTVSLKQIDDQNHCAEFAIVVSRMAMGTGIAAYAMREMIERGFSELDLEVIQWCVNPDNVRAIRFYDKSYRQIELPLSQIKKRYSGERLLWYEVKRDETWHD